MQFWGVVFTLRWSTFFNRLHPPWSPEYFTKVAERCSALVAVISAPDSHKCIAPILDIPNLQIVPRAKRVFPGYSVLCLNSTRAIESTLVLSNVGLGASWDIPSSLGLRLPTTIYFSLSVLCPCSRGASRAWVTPRAKQGNLTLLRESSVSTIPYTPVS